MLPVQFVYLAAVINLCATCTYAYATLQGRTQPNRVTWFFWGLSPLIAAAAQFSDGVGLSTLPVLMPGLGPVVIFLCSFVNKKAYWQIDLFDYGCGGLALIGLVAWQLTGNPVTAIIFSILSDFFASIPTLRKCYSRPESEKGQSFIFALCAALLGLLCVQEFRFAAYGFITYLVAINVALCLTIYRRKILRLAVPS